MVQTVSIKKKKAGSKMKKINDTEVKEEMEEKLVAEEDSNGTSIDSDGNNVCAEELNVSDEDEEEAEEEEEEEEDGEEEEEEEVENEDDEEEEDEDDEEEEDEGYEESLAKNVTNQSHATEKSKLNKRVVFDDDDETFGNLLVLTSNVATKSVDVESEESDSDAPPDEESISTGKDIFEEDDKKMKSEVLKLKNQVKEARRLKHEKNKEQQQRKRQRLEKLENSRLPADLLDAVATEKKEPKKVTIPVKMGKRKTFDDDDDLSDKELCTETFNDDDLITLEQGVKVRAVQQEVKKHGSIASIAADFRQKAIYNKKAPRMSSLDQRRMLVKQKKSGKNLLVS